MFKNLVLFGAGLVGFCGSAQAASVYHYDTQKIKAILDSRDVEMKFAGKLPNGKFAGSIQGIGMGAVDTAKSQIQFTMKSAGCSLPVTVSFKPNDFNPNYQVTAVGTWVCP